MAFTDHSDLFAAVPAGPGRRSRLRPAAAHILAGQSIVLLAETPRRFLVEPTPSGP